MQPIGIGEILRRLVGKVLARVFKQDFEEATGPVQVCARHEAGAEAAIHVMHQIWDKKNTEEMLLIDANNAFNSLNRKVALHNILILCPRPAITIINTYRRPSRLFVAGGRELQSQEGATQGDPLPIPFYTVSVAALIVFLQIKLTEVKQAWLADDCTAAGSLCALLKFLNMIIIEGEKYGYLVNTGKSWLIIKNSCDLGRATELFKNHDIKLSTEGQSFLGAVIGSSSFKEKYANNKVSVWCNELERLSSIAKSQPHAAYSTFVHEYKHKFTYFMRTIPNAAHLFRSVEDIISTGFIPSIFGQEISHLDRQLYALPIRDGGLGIPCIPDTDFELYSSKVLSAPLSALIISQSFIQLPHPEKTVIRKAISRLLRQDNNETIRRYQKKLSTLIHLKRTAKCLTDNPNETKLNQA